MASNIITTIEPPRDGPKDVKMADRDLSTLWCTYSLDDVEMAALELCDEDVELDYDIEVEDSSSAEDIEMGALYLRSDEGIEMGDRELDEDKDIRVGELNDGDMEMEDRDGDEDIEMEDWDVLNNLDPMKNLTTKM